MTEPHLPRTALIQRVLSDPRPIVVLDAVAGMGKSVLLAQLAAATGSPVHTGAAPPQPGAALILWDLPDQAPCPDLPATFLTGQTRIILAKRPNLHLPNLDRAEVYGLVLRLTSRDLAFTPADLTPPQFAATGGWPLLLGALSVPDALMTRFLQSQIMANLAPADLVRLANALTDGHTPRLASLTLLPDHIPHTTIALLRAAARTEITADDTFKAFGLYRSSGILGGRHCGVCPNRGDNEHRADLWHHRPGQDQRLHRLYGRSEPV